MADEPNVNNLNGIPNFGFGMPADGIVQAGVTDVPQEIQQDVQVDTPQVAIPVDVPEQPVVEQVDITNQQ